VFLLASAPQASQSFDSVQLTFRYVKRMAHELQGAAIVMRRYGGPDVLRPEIVAAPSLLLDEIRIRSIGSAVNHSDLEIRAGNWPILTADPFPYTPGLEVVGEVVDVGAAVSDIRVGDRVITMMQGLGGVRPRRPGGYAEYVTVSASAAATLPASVDPLDMAALGLGSVTAFEGLQKIGDLKDGRIAVTGAAGGVGSAAVAIARAQGAEVIGIVSRPEHAEYVRSLGAAETITATDVAAGALAPETIDGVLDTVGGESFASYLEALRRGGVLSLVGAVGGSDVSFDAYRLLEVTLTGYASDTLDGAALRRAVRFIFGWLSKGQIRAPDRREFLLADAAAAHAKLEQRSVQGRVVLIPGR
jgi:NADPH:quinone reductase